jgi:hypothetical protein
MKRIVRLTESDLVRLVKRVIAEGQSAPITLTFTDNATKDRFVAKFLTKGSQPNTYIYEPGRNPQERLEFVKLQGGLAGKKLHDEIVKMDPVGYGGELGQVMIQIGGAQKPIEFNSAFPQTNPKDIKNMYQTNQGYEFRQAGK